MGFLDFYGNCFDPRTTGISVRRKQYFARPNYAAAHHQAATGQPMWGASHQQRVIPAPPPPPQIVVATGKPDFRRRNSENAMSSDGGVRARPPRFQHGGTTPHRSAPHHTIPPSPHATDHQQQQQRNHNHNNAFGPTRPYTFDPLFVEDPLTAGNNVGRNAFRINQVQRAFSDAHRALVASLASLWIAASSSRRPLLVVVIVVGNGNDAGLALLHARAQPFFSPSSLGRHASRLSRR